MRVYKKHSFYNPKNLKVGDRVNSIRPLHPVNFPSTGTIAFDPLRTKKCKFHIVWDQGGWSYVDECRFEKMQETP